MRHPVRHLVRAVTAALAVAALATVPAAGQGWALGFEGGLNVSDLSLDPDSETDSELGLRAGGVLRYDFMPDGLIGIHTGATYSRKGATDTSEDVEIDLNLDYLEVPVVVAVNIPTDGAAVQPRLYAGGSFNFELSCDVSVGDDTTGESFDCDEEGADVLERSSFDLGLRLGGGLDFEVSPNAAVTVDAGYDFGLTDIADSEAVEAKNRNLFVTGGFIFHP